MADSPANEITGCIFDVQRFSIHDGPGIRTTVFMKGCPLHCSWCHNPESVARGLHLSYVPTNCIGCGYCFRVCPNQVHERDPDNAHVLDRGRCVVCGECTAECYARALELVGREATVKEVIDEVLRDLPFYETSDGGMTLSGGEPLLQIEFSEALLKAGKEAGLHNAIETCGHAQYDRIERVLPFTDFFLFDVKDMNEERHKEHTGLSNELILENLRKLHDAGAEILVRLPIVPGVNDRDDHFDGAAELVKSLPKLQGTEVMPYHRLGTSKRERMGLEQETDLAFEAPSEEEVAGWVHALRDRGLKVINEV